MNYKRYFVISMLFMFVFVSVFAIGGSNVKASDQGLVAHYTFDGDLKDSAGSNNGQKGSGKITFVDGKIGKGAKFDGVSHFEVENSDSLQLTEAFTFSVWLFRDRPLDQGAMMPILCKGGLYDDLFESSYRFWLGYGAETAEIGLIDEDQSRISEYSSDATVPTQNWIHLVVTYDGVKATFYKNGTKCTTEIITAEVSEIYSNDHNLYIGKDSVYEVYYRGIMDDLRIYDRALTEGEIKNLTRSAPSEPSAVPTGPTVAVPQGLMAYYTFEDNFNDSSGNNNTGSSIGNVAFVDGTIGKGAKFDGASYIKVRDSNSLDIEKALTFSVWLYKDEPSVTDIRAPILCKGQTDDFFETPYRFFLGYGSTYPEISLIDKNESDCAELFSEAAVSTHQWTHVAVTWDGKWVRFYKNGVLSDDPFETEYMTTMLCNDNNLEIGMDTVEGGFFKGIMDDLRIYNRALSDAEIKSLYEVILSGVTPIHLPGTVPSQIPVTIPEAPGKLSELKPTTLGLPEAPSITIILQIDNPKMYVNGGEQEIDPGYGTKPIILSGRTVLPIRAIIESLGGNVGWDQAEQRITLDVNDTNIMMWIGRQEYLVNGVPQTLEVAPIVVNSRTLLPLRTILENIGYVVEWNNENNAVIIVSRN